MRAKNKKLTKTNERIRTKLGRYIKYPRHEQIRTGGKCGKRKSDIVSKKQKKLPEKLSRLTKRINIHNNQKDKAARH